MKKRFRMSDFIFDAVVYAGVTLAAIITLYPFIWVLSMSISDPVAVTGNRVWLYPVGFSLEAYKLCFAQGPILRGYLNTIWYTIVGTLISITLTVMGAYPLSLKNFVARKFFTVVFVFTMFFNGGLIPFFILVGNLHLYNTRWALVIPCSIGTWYLIICRTFFQSLPGELFESAKIDGCSEFRMLLSILVPLSKPILAVLALFYGIGNWNSWFWAMLFLPNDKLQPLQTYLQRIVVMQASDMVSLPGKNAILEQAQLKYCVIMVACIPIMCVYPFAQKYFVKGMLIGSLKG